jgi:hypothetical protein
MNEVTQILFTIEGRDLHIHGLMGRLCMQPIIDVRSEGGVR